MSKLSERPQNKNFGKRAGIASGKKTHEETKNRYYQYPKHCLHCNNVIPYEKRINKFCSSSCSCSYNNARRNPPSDEQKEKVSKSMSSFHRKNRKLPYTKRTSCKVQFSKCKICGSSFYVRHHRHIKDNRCSSCKENEYTSIYLSKCECCKSQYIAKSPGKYCKNCSPNIRHYRTRTKFCFNVFEFPEEFDLELVKEFGWYSPNGYKRRNKQPNLNGVSRDHLFSVLDGFKNKVNPEILGHPANCRIMKHNGNGGNNQKNSESAITLDELFERIKQWDKKYPS